MEHTRLRNRWVLSGAFPRRCHALEDICTLTFNFVRCPRIFSPIAPGQAMPGRCSGSPRKGNVLIVTYAGDFGSYGAVAMKERFRTLEAIALRWEKGRQERAYKSCY